MDGQGYAVGWFTLALVNAGLAQSKLRSGLVWFVISVAFGPLATLWIVAAIPVPGRQVSGEAPGQVRPAHGS